jgi:hypothetical protein
MDFRSSQCDLLTRQNTSATVCMSKYLDGEHVRALPSVGMGQEPGPVGCS